MISFTCRSCSAALQAEESQAGQLIRCPTCKATMTAPQAPSATPPTPTQRTGETFHSAGRRYGFNCPYCSSRLEANELMAAQEGQCPTCGSAIIIPILDRQGRLIDPATKKVIKPDPHPVHAYAAAGERAPTIRRSSEGQQLIVCPRCGTASPITANNCRSCGMPFTIEGTMGSDAGSSNGFCVASLVLGIIGIPTAYFCLPAVLAIVFGCVGYFQTSRPGTEAGGKGMAIGGLACGIIGLGLFLGFVIH